MEKKVVCIKVVNEIEDLRIKFVGNMEKADNQSFLVLSASRWMVRRMNSQEKVGWLEWKVWRI